MYLGGQKNWNIAIEQQVNISSILIFTGECAASTTEQPTAIINCPTIYRKICSIDRYDSSRRAGKYNNCESGTNSTASNIDRAAAEGINAIGGISPRFQICSPIDVQETSYIVINVPLLPGRNCYISLDRWRGTQYNRQSSP